MVHPIDRKSIEKKVGKEEEKGKVAVFFVTPSFTHTL
jgi:hypothetical protein